MLASFVAVCSKYIFAYQKSHIFNPAAIAAFSLSVLGNGNATWWIGSAQLLPLVLVLGFIVTRKLKRQAMVIFFLLVASLFASLRHFPLEFLWVSGPLVFFATIMLTEPLTTPPTKKSQLTYSLFAGVWFTQFFNFGPIYGGPEFALLLSNFITFTMWPRQRLLLTLQKVEKVATDVYSYSFSVNKKLSYLPGQYLEWTVPHLRPDFRGNRRWFSLASSPTEDTVILGTKIFPDKSSSLKKHLLNLKKGTHIEAHQFQGDFILPKNKSTKLCLIAGGIGITPFRSMVKYSLDKNEYRDIVLLYANNDKYFAYQDIFDQIKSIYHDTSTSGYVTNAFIKNNIPDYASRHFYISGPPPMVDSYKKILLSLKVKNIHTDYFPGC